MTEALAALSCGIVALLLWLAPAAIVLLVQVVWSREAAARLAAFERRLDARLARLERAGPAASEAIAAPSPEVAAETEAPSAEGVAPSAGGGLGAPAATEPPPTATEPAPKPPRPTPSPGPSLEQLFMWVAGGVGGLALVLGALLALAWAAEQGWLGPAVRVSLAMAAGTASWLVGTWAHGRYRVVGAALSGAGIGTLYGALYAASSLYGFVPPTAAFVLMVAVTALATAAATRLRARFLAHLGLVGGLLTPVLVATGENNPAGLFGWLVLLSSGVLFAASRRGWWDVVGSAALGSAALHLGWTASWYAADQTPAGLLGALALAVPFAVAARRAPRLAVSRAALAAAVGLPFLALPWLVPVDPVFTDPRNGLDVVRGAGASVWWAAGAVALLAAPGWLAARREGSAVAVLAGAFVTSLHVAAFVTGWNVWHSPPPGAVVLGAVGPLLVGVGALAGRRDAGIGLFPLPLVAGGALAGWLAVADPEGGAVAAGAVAIAAAGVVGAMVSAPAWLLAPTLLGVAALLAVAGLRVEDVGLRWVVGPTLLAYALLSYPPLLRRWEAARKPAWAVAALAGPALFPPLYLAWRSGLGQGAIGVLPVLLGANALLSAAVLVRAWRIDRGDAVLALYVAVALAGVTFALPVQLAEAWLTVGWALEAAALAWLARHLRHPLLPWAAVALAVIVSVRLLLNPWALAWGDAGGWPVLNWTLYAWGVPALCLLATARLLPSARGPLAFAPGVLTVLAVLVGFALVNVEVVHAFQDAGPLELGGGARWESAARSVAWAVYALAVIAAGWVADRPAVRAVGFLLLLVAAAKVFLVDLWSLQGFFRVVSVLGLGACLIAAAFAFERLVLRAQAKESP